MLIPNQIDLYITKSKLSNLSVMYDSSVVLIRQLQAFNRFLPGYSVFQEKAVINSLIILDRISSVQLTS